MKANLRTALITAAAAVVMPLMSGCTYHLGDFTLLASKNVDLTRFRTDLGENSQQVVGTDEAWSFVGIGGIPNLKEAIDRAEEQGHAPALTNARLTAYYWNAFIVGNMKFEARGNPSRLQ